MGRLDPGRGQKASVCCCQHLSDHPHLSFRSAGPLKGHYFAPYVCRANLDLHTHTHTLTLRYQTLWLWGKIIYALKIIPIHFICWGENCVSWSCTVSGEHRCLLAEAYTIPGAQHQSACIQDRLDENTNMVRTQTLTNADVDKLFVFIWFSLRLGNIGQNLSAAWGVSPVLRWWVTTGRHDPSSNSQQDQWYGLSFIQSASLITQAVLCRTTLTGTIIRQWRHPVKLKGPNSTSV